MTGSTRQAQWRAQARRHGSQSSTNGEIRVQRHDCSNCCAPSDAMHGPQATGEQATSQTMTRKPSAASKLCQRVHGSCCGGSRTRGNFGPGGGERGRFLTWNRVLRRCPRGLAMQCDRGEAIAKDTSVRSSFSHTPPVMTALL